MFSFPPPQKYAYKSQPIIIKNAFEHWPAKEQLTYQFLKQLYQKYPNELERFDEECQFLPFESSFGSLREFFEMPIEQIESGKPTWYIGFSNCQLNILAELRQLYQKPHFLPEDAELSNTDYIFLGYDDGAVIHVIFNGSFVKWFLIFHLYVFGFISSWITYLD